jgi:hypothetical protein
MRKCRILWCAWAVLAALPPTVVTFAEEVATEIAPAPIAPPIPPPVPADSAIEHESNGALNESPDEQPASVDAVHRFLAAELAEDATAEPVESSAASGSPGVPMPVPAPVAAAAALLNGEMMPPPPLPASPAPSSPPAPAAPASSSFAAPAGGALANTNTDATSSAMAPVDGSVEPTGCATCGGFHSAIDGPMIHQQTFGCADGSCIPGRKPCYPPANPCDTVVGEFLSNLYQCLCCPDPCYQPRWEPAANASFFVDYARPRTVTRFRFDRLIDMTSPTRSEFFMKRTNPNFPVTLTGPRGGRRTFQSDPSLNMSQLYFYQEAATERASVFFEIPYRQINPLWSPTQAGFADLNFGTKALLFDCELLQVTFQFRTYMPSGNAGAGLGTGHVTLDPSILTALKLGPETYFQSQFGNFSPLGGTPNVAGGVFYWLMSLNHTLCHLTPDSPLIATLEMDGWSFENGGYYAPSYPAGMKGINGRQPGLLGQSGVSYFNMGPGLRASICNKVDFGGAITWATTGNHWADPWFRVEMRFLF